MSQSDPHVIRDEAGLREVVGETMPGMDIKVRTGLDEFSREFLALSPFIVLSTSDTEGNLDASPKGDGPGFVYCEDDRTIVIPDRPGNKLVYGHLNILRNPRVGVIFFVPGTSETLRINGTAELTSDPALLAKLDARGKPAVLGIRVRIDECFFHCGKALIRSKLWDHASWPEKLKVSFGQMVKLWTGADDAVAEGVDASIEQDYRENL
jgi:PPOX class probable FMN-dependent enzyme